MSPRTAHRPLKQLHCPPNSRDASINSSATSIRSSAASINSIAWADLGSGSLGGGRHVTPWQVLLRDLLALPPAQAAKCTGRVRIWRSAAVGLRGGKVVPLAGAGAGAAVVAASTAAATTAGAGGADAETSEAAGKERG
eukprot:1092575-Rhodomonas_salina.1